MATTERDVQDHPTLQCSTLAEAFQLTATQHAGQVALRTPDDSVSIIWAEYADRVERLAGGLASLGVGHGDTVAIMLLNRPEFHLVDSAALHLGATPFSVYNTSTRDQVEHLFSNAGTRVLVTQAEFLPVVRTWSSTPSSSTTSRRSRSAPRRTSTSSRPGGRCSRRTC